MKEKDVIKKETKVIGKFGVTDENDNIIVPIEYDFVNKVNENLFVAIKGNIDVLRYNGMNLTGTIKQCGNDAVIFDEHLKNKTLETSVDFYTVYGKLRMPKKVLAAYVCKNENMFLIVDEDYKWSMIIIDCENQTVRSGGYMYADSIKLDYYNNRFIVYRNNQYIVVSFKEDSLIHEKTLMLDFKPVKLYDRGVVVKKNDKYGFVDYSGKLILSCIYDEVTPRKAAIQTVTNGGVELFTYDGHLIIGGENYDWCQRYTFKDIDLFMLGHKDGTYCLCSSNKQLLACEYDSIEMCEEFAIVCKNKKYGLLRYDIDLDEMVSVFPPEYPKESSETMEFVYKKEDVYVKVDGSKKKPRYLFALSKLSNNKKI